MKAVEIKGLRYSYPDGREALLGVNLDIDEGESVGLIGGNGAGKTTLLLHLNGTLRGAGEIRILGVKLDTGAGVASVRGRVGIVFQDPNAQLFCPTVREDVAFGPVNMDLSPGEVDRRVEDALHQVGLEGFEERAPHHLSVGEQRLAGLATVLSMRPELLVLDEPAANLDPRARREMMALLESLRITRIVASHDLDFVARTCRRVVLLSAGAVMADGPAPDLLGNEGLLRRGGL